MLFDLWNVDVLYSSKAVVEQYERLVVDDGAVFWTCWNSHRRPCRFFECLEREKRVTSDAISLNRLQKYHQQFTSRSVLEQTLGL